MQSNNTIGPETTFVVSAILVLIRVPTGKRPRDYHLSVVAGIFHDEGIKRVATVSPIVRVLVVEDFKSFRQFICSMLTKMPELQIVGEASDGLEAVRKAEELRPDLILLDVGLPTLNGIEAARRIRTLCPESKLIFVSQQSDPGVVEEALNLGALGYVAKTMAATDVLLAVKAVSLGKQFVSPNLSPIASLTNVQDASF